MLGAELTVTAISGIGVLPRPYHPWFSTSEAGNCTRGGLSDAGPPFVAGYPGENAQFGLPKGIAIRGMGDYIDRVNPFEPASPANEYKYGDHRTPGAILLLIGPNDFNSTAKPTYWSLGQFKAAYRQMLESRTRVYRHAVVKPKLISVCGGSINGLQPCPYIREVVEEFNHAARSDGFRAFYTTVESDVWHSINNNTKYNGCNEHYNPRGHGVVASQIAPQVAQIMDWCQEADTRCKKVIGPGSYCKYWQRPGVCEGAGAEPCQC